MQQVPTILPNGSIVRDRYMIESLLGKGGFGAVYLVHDVRVKGNQFALKEVIDPKKQDRVHFLFEGEVLRRLDHISLPRVYRAFEDTNHYRVYLLMDYIKGPNLDQLRRLQPSNRFALSDTIRILTPIVEALTFLQNQQPPIVHRDIKPSNIIIPPDGSVPVLVDFGIAKEYDEDATTTAIRRLSPNYSALEQYSQGTNLSTDVYGLAATLYCLLTGIPPIDAFDRVTQRGISGTDPLPAVNSLVPSIPLPVSDAIERAMALMSDERFPTIEAFWNALRPQSLLAAPIVSVTPTRKTPVPTAAPALATVSTSATKHSSQSTQKQPANRRRLILPLLAIVALIAVVLGALFATNIYSRATVTRGPASPVGSTQPQKTATTQILPSPSPTPRKPLATPTQPSKPTEAPTYPHLDSQYVGSIHNASANINGVVTLTHFYQNGPVIGGTLVLSNGLSGTAAFVGTVSHDGKIQFVVTPYTQYLPLLFQGQVTSDSHITGTYCSIRNNQCDYSSGGYGTWAATPYTSSSLAPWKNDFFA